MHQLLYITCANDAQARAIAHALLESKLIACANIIPGLTSCYEWQGAIQESLEVLLLAKTTPERFEAAKAFVLSHHSYECPCIVALDIASGHTPFLHWIDDQTTPAS